MYKIVGNCRKLLKIVETIKNIDFNFKMYKNINFVFENVQKWQEIGVDTETY